MVQRALAPYHQPISSLTLHAFGDASAKGVSAAVYAIVHQDQGVTQQLVCAKSGLAKKNLTIPRLELVAGHMAVNLVTNVQAALNFLPHETHCWFDSTVALYWIKGQEEHRQLNLQYSDKQVLECRGRIIGEYPIYLSDDHLFIVKGFEQEHTKHHRQETYPKAGAFKVIAVDLVGPICYILRAKTKSKAYLALQPHQSRSS